MIRRDTMCHPPSGETSFNTDYYKMYS
uniref:Uncharacterized protein n=1 Tax=Arundo donax TaxID=35708 RepID=A0A0A9GPF7_ARUDO